MLKHRSSHFDIDIITGNDLLPSNGTNLDLDIDNAEGLGADVNLNETGVDGLVELAESRDKANRTCQENCQHFALI